MKFFRFLKYFYMYAAGTLSWPQAMYLVREGIDPRTPARIGWSADLRVVDKEPENERERILPLKNHTILLKDLTMLKPDVLVFHTTDSEKAEAAIERLKFDLTRMPCHEFYDRWVLHPNFDFLITAEDRIGRI